MFKIITLINYSFDALHMYIGQMSTVLVLYLDRIVCLVENKVVTAYLTQAGWGPEGGDNGN